MELNSLQEVQNGTSIYNIKLLNGEVIKLDCIQSEDINESADGSMFIILKSATYNDRLYNTFKNGELIDCIRKDTLTKNIKSLEDIKHSYEYKKYFKINNFSTEYSNDSYGTYGIELTTV